MCGICGYLEPGRKSYRAELEHSVCLMALAIRHRGPDDTGFWTSPGSGIAFGFRRLAILDLSANGHQPMMSANNRYIIIYNGEIYNYMSLRMNLEQKGHRFNGHSDTEVMLAAFCEWGVMEAVKHFNGMFAIALWDKQEQLLHLIRDRIGVKPLYYGWNQSNFYFSSELKAIRAHPSFQAEIDQYAMGQFFRYSYVPSPNSIYRGIYKLSPGSILTINVENPKEPAVPEFYWKIDPVGNNGANGIYKGNDEEALTELEVLLKESVRLRMIADVPLGAFLSGGVDSSTVVALMQAQSARPIKTFTIGFQEERYDEAGHAKAVAEHLGTDHTELYVTPQEAMAVIPKLPHIYDEPFADSSQIPTFMVSNLARKEVTVSLSGDGGDELFLGYNRYRWAQKIWKSVGWLPQSSKAWLSKLIQDVPATRWDSMYDKAARFMPHKLQVPQFGDKIQKLATLLDKETPGAIYDRLVTFWENPTDLIASTGLKPFPQLDFNGFGGKQAFGEWMSWLDIHTYLPDDILVKLDRASMAASLEARVPLLDDHRVVEFATRLPYSMKYKNGKSKWLLRKLLYKYVPVDLVERPKMGFGVPIDRWLRGPLRPWAEELLDPRQMDNQGILKSRPIQDKWREHLSGSRNWQYHLWNILMFQAWFYSV